MFRTEDAQVLMIQRVHSAMRFSVSRYSKCQIPQVGSPISLNAVSYHFLDHFHTCELSFSTQ